MAATVAFSALSVIPAAGHNWKVTVPAALSRSILVVALSVKPRTCSTSSQQRAWQSTSSTLFVTCRLRHDLAIWAHISYESVKYAG